MKTNDRDVLFQVKGVEVIGKNFEPMRSLVPRRSNYQGIKQPNHFIRRSQVFFEPVNSEFRHFSEFPRFLKKMRGTRNDFKLLFGDYKLQSLSVKF